MDAHLSSLVGGNCHKEPVIEHSTCFVPDIGGDQLTIQRLALSPEGRKRCFSYDTLRRSLCIQA